MDSSNGNENSPPPKKRKQNKNVSAYDLDKDAIDLLTKYYTQVISAHNERQKSLKETKETIEQIKEKIEKCQVEREHLETQCTDITLVPSDDSDSD